MEAGRLPRERRQKGRQFLEMITDSFPCLSCLWKEKERPPALHPHRSSTHCVTAPTWLPSHPTTSTHLNPSLVVRQSLLLHALSLLLPCFGRFVSVFQQTIFFVLLSFLTISRVLPLSCTLNYCRNEGPTCKQFPHEINLGLVPFHMGALTWPGSCLLQVAELAQTKANGWKSLTNLSNSCLQSPFFLCPLLQLCVPWLLFFPFFLPHPFAFSIAAKKYEMSALAD